MRHAGRWILVYQLIHVSENNEGLFNRMMGEGPEQKGSMVNFSAPDDGDWVRIYFTVAFSSKVVFIG